MKKGFLVVVAVFLLSPMMAGLAQADRGYLIGKAGVYIPSGSGENAGFNGEIGYGLNLMPGPGLLALEGTIGYFRADQSDDYYIGFQNRYRVTFDADVVPLALSLKAGVETGPFTFYVGGGVDLLLVNMEMKYDNRYSRYSDNDNETLWGGHVMAGATFELNPRMFIGLEAKYLATESMDMSFYGGQTVLSGDLNGFTITGLFGFRF